MRAEIGNGGWLRFSEPERPLTYVRFAPGAGSRLRARELYVEAPDGEPIAPSHVRELPLHAYEAIANDEAEEVRDRMATPGPNLSVLAGQFARSYRTYDGKPTSWVHESMQAQVDSVAGRAAAKRQPDPDPVPDPVDRPRSRLPVHERQPLDDSFYRRLAAAYMDAVREGLNPAPALADDARVPVGTVHRWVHQARQGGYLPPGKQGRAG